MRVRARVYSGDVIADAKSRMVNGFVVMPAVVVWNIDLLRLRCGDISFEQFAKKHIGIVRLLAARWARRCPERLGVEDAVQEALLEIWRAVDCWDDQRNVPLHAFVRSRVRFRLLGMTDRALKGRDIDTRYLRAHGRRDDAVPDEVAPTVEVTVEANRRFARIVGSLDARDAEFVMGLIAGERLDDVRRETYSTRTVGGAVRKARSVIRFAAQVAAHL